jgi:hypothetical protein
VIINDNSNIFIKYIKKIMDKQFIDRVIVVLEKPYFKSLDNMGIDDKELIQDIFNKLYNDNVDIDYDDNRIYDDNSNLLYYEDPNGYWAKREYDDYGNLIYRENSYGYWEKREFDHNGNMLYFEDSDGEIVDNRSGNINESYDSNFINRVIEVLELPYFKSLDSMGIDDKDLIQDIFNTIYNDNVDIDYDDDYDDYNIYNSNGKRVYYEDPNGFWTKREYDENGNRIYYEDSRGYWIKSEFNHNGNLIYRENSNGYWVKREFDHNGNMLYFEDSDGVIKDNR